MSVTQRLAISLIAAVIGVFLLDLAGRTKPAGVYPITGPGWRSAVSVSFS